MTQTANHARLPWEDNDAGLIYGQVSGDDDAAPFVCDVCDSPLEYTEQEKANAAFIVRACNAHQDMAEALKDSIQCFECSTANLHWMESYIDKARTAFAKATA
jgi:hypothetical protein